MPPRKLDTKPQSDENPKMRVDLHTNLATMGSTRDSGNLEVESGGQNQAEISDEEQRIARTCRESRALGVLVLQSVVPTCQPLFFFRTPHCSGRRILATISSFLFTISKELSRERPIITAEAASIRSDFLGATKLLDTGSYFASIRSSVWGCLLRSSIPLLAECCFRRPIKTRREMDSKRIRFLAEIAQHCRPPLAIRRALSGPDSLGEDVIAGH
jgi:hypothetical protein